MPSKVRCPQAGSVSVNIVGAEHFPEPGERVHVIGTPDGSLLDICSVDEIPAFDVVAVDFDLELADSRKTKHSALSENTAGKIERILQYEIILGKGRTVEGDKRAGDVSGHSHGRIRIKSLIAVQTESEIRCADILRVPQRNSSAVGGTPVHVADGSHVDIINPIGIRSGAQRKSSKQENSKHKKYRKSILAEFFRFYHAIQFSSFPYKDAY